MQLAGHFKQYTYTAGTVVYAQNGSLVLLLVTVLVCVWTAVPVGTKKNASFAFRIVCPDDIARLQNGIVVCHQVDVLVIDFGSKLFQFICQELSASFVCGCIWNTRAEVGLSPDIKIGAVCIEWGTLTVLLVVVSSLSSTDLLLLLLHATIATISNSNSEMNV